MEEYRRKSTSLGQLELLITFMEKRNDFAKGKLRTKEGLIIAARLWAECAAILNTEGVTRTPKEWSRFWNDYKSRVRVKVVKINRRYRATRGRPTMAQPLTPLEERVAALLGRDAAGAASTSSVGHTTPAPEASTTVTVETPPIVGEREQKDPVNVERVNQPADQGITLPQTVRPRNQGQRRIHRRVRRQRQNTAGSLEEIRAFIVRIEERLTRREETPATSQRKLEALTSIATSLTSIATSLTSIATSLTRIATSFDIIATSLHTYLSRLQRNN